METTTKIEKSNTQIYYATETYTYCVGGENIYTIL